MKLRILLIGLTLLFVSLGVAAKDIITTTDGKNIDAKVEEITETVIKYRKASNPNGPLYTIAISSVATIKYENGDIDTFSGSAKTAIPASPSKLNQSQNGTMTDDELLRQAGNQDNSINQNSNQGVSDTDLLKMEAKYSNYVYFNDDMMKDVKKAKSYRIIGWIGSGVLLAAGIGVGLGLYATDYNDYGDYGAEMFGIMVGGLVAGTAWCLGFNLKANSLMKRAKASGYYSATIFESEILRNGDKSLMAGINVLGNRFSNDKCCGISLKFNF